MKKSAKALALTAALAVLAAAWLVVESMGGEMTLRAEETPEEEPMTIALSAGTAEDIQALSWTYGGETVSLAWDEEATLWENAEDRDCPIDQNRVRPLVEAVTDVHALLSIRDVTDFAQYGLDDPIASVTVETADHTVTYTLGHQTLTGEYYLRVDEGNTVYTEQGSLLPAFRLGLEDLLYMEPLPVDMAAVTAMAVTSEAGDYLLTYKATGADVWYGSAYRWYVTRDGETYPLTAESAAALYGMVTELSYLRCVDWHEENFSRYGLDTPQVTAVISYISADGSEKMFTLRFGDYEGGAVYVNPEGSEVVYLVDGAAADGLMRPDWDAMTPLLICPMDPGRVMEIVAELGGHTYDIVLHRERTEEETTDGDAASEEKIFYVSNGWTLDETAAAAWLEDLFTLEGESLGGNAAGGELCLSLTVRTDSENWPEIKAELYRYDSARFLCVINGETGYFLSRERAEELIAGAESLLILE